MRTTTAPRSARVRAPAVLLLVGLLARVAVAPAPRRASDPSGSPR